MRIITIIKIFMALFCIICTFVLSSCGNLVYYACSVNAFGSEPVEKTYYVNVSDSLYKENFTYREHIQNVKNTLSRIGYREMPKATAALVVDYDLAIGEIEYAGSSSYTTTQNIGLQNVNTKINQALPANTYIKGSAYSISTGVSVTHTGARYKIPIKCTLSASDKECNKVWKVEIYDYMKHEADDELKIRFCVPWMLAAAEQYIGKDIVVPRVLIGEGPGQKKYGLTWHQVLFDGFDSFIGRY